MATDSRIPLADEFAAINQRMREIAADDRPTKWALRFKDSVWLRIDDDKVPREATLSRATVFATFNEAIDVVVSLKTTSEIKARITVERLPDRE